MRRLLLAAGFLIVCAGFAGAADQYLPANMSAPDIILKVRAARGTPMPGRFVIVEQIHGGGIDTKRTTHIDGPNSISVSESGGFTAASGFYNGQSWSQDENGLVLIRSNFRRYVDPNTQAMLHPENPANHVRVLGLTQSAPQEYVLESNPPGGSDQFRYIDAKTFLTDKIVTLDADMYRHVIEFSDYRPAFGTMRPFRIHAYDGRPENDTVTTTLSYERATGKTDPIVMPSSRPLYTIDRPIRIPATFADEGIILRVTIAGRGLDFLLDSGASGLFIDPGVAHQLGLAAYGKIRQTIGGDIDVSRTRVPEVHVGDLTMRDVAFSVVPFSQYAGGATLVGILGCDFIAGSVLGVNFKDQSVTLYPSSFDPKAQGMITLPLQLDDGIPRVQASFENIPGFFMVDTGAMSTLVYQNYANKLKDTLTAPSESSMRVVGGTVPAQIRQIKDLRFGGILYENATVFVPTTSTFNLSDYDGILGRDVLSQYEVLFNYAKRELYLKPL